MVISKFLSAYISGIVFALLTWPFCAAQGRDCIGVVPAGGGHTFWGEVEKGALRAGAELGVDIYFRGPANENNPQTQVTVINTIEQKHCIALVLAPNVPEREADVARLKKLGIPTVYIDRDYGCAQAVGVLLTNNYQAGKLAGEHMASLLKGRGKVAVFHMMKGIQSTDAREAGFLAAALANGLSVSAEAWLGSGIGEARTASLKALSQLAEPIDGIFTPNESTTQASLLSLKQLGLAGKITFIGFDVSPILVEAIRSKTLNGIIIQKPVEMGYQGVRMAYQAVLGKLPTQCRTNIDVQYVSSSNIDTPPVAYAIAPFAK